MEAGPNQPNESDQLEQAIVLDVIATLSKRTVRLREELHAKLARELPDAVETFTPQGRLPIEEEAAWLIYSDSLSSRWQTVNRFSM